VTDGLPGPAGPDRDGRRRHGAPAAVVAVVVIASVLLLAAAAVIWVGRSSPDQPAAVVTRAPSPVAVPVTTQRQQATPTDLPGAGVPRRVVVTSLGVDAPVLPIVAEGQSLDPPSDPQSLGWWSQGARPGAARGTALVTGHTVHDGGGALDDLETLRRGAEIHVLTAHGRVRYVVDSVVVLDKDAIARRAPQLFSQEVAGRLVLVTCEGWDGTGYRSNVVVTATPAT
jgi:hypothetical protein